MHDGSAIDVRLMGRFVVVSDGAEVPASTYRGRKVRTLLRILATRQGQFITNDELTEMLWTNRPPNDPAANLQVLVNRARRATACAPLIVTGPGGYALAEEPMCTVDTQTFLAALDRAAAMTPEQALVSLRQTLSDYAGEPLAEDRYSDWAEPYRARVLQARQSALERAAELARIAGDVRLAVDYARTAATAEPLREVAAVQLVRALAESGDVAAALTHYDGYRRILARELGVDPSPNAQLLQAELLAGHVASPVESSGTPASSPFRQLRFVGRNGDRDEIVREVTGNSRGAVTIAGASGSGKSRLLAEVEQALPVGLVVRAFWPERDEPWAVARSLLSEVLAADALAAEGLPLRMRTALAWLSPEVETGSTTPIDPESRRALVGEGITRLLGQMSDPVLLLDDLQWTDATSLELLASVLEREPLALVVAFRSDEIAHGSMAERFLTRLRVVQSFELDAFDDAALTDLVADPSLVEAIATSTDRTPMLVAEVLRSLAADGLATVDRSGRWQVASGTAVARAREVGAAGQRRAILSRTQNLPGDVRELLFLLALRAAGSSAATLAAAAGVTESRALRGLGALGAAGLVKSTDVGWLVAHDLIGEVLIGQLDHASRARLHGNLAAALASSSGDRVEVAEHYVRAGDTARAVQAYAAGARAALEAFADSEAEGLAERGLLAQPGAPEEAELLEIRAEARRRRGDITGSRADLRASLVPECLPADRARRLTNLASLASGADDLERASELVELALVEAGADQVAQARALETAAIIDMNLGRPERARARSAAALATFQRLGDSRGAARILDADAMATFLGGDIRAGTSLLHKAANLFEDYGDLARLVTPRSTRGHGLVFLDRAADGLADSTAALEVARTLGQPEGQAYALWHCSEAMSALGRGAEAVGAGREALDLAVGIGHRGWTATAWRAIGIAEQVRGNLPAALSAFEASLDASTHLDLFAAWAAARTAWVLVDLGRVDEARPYARQALTTGPPLGWYEGRVAEAELALATGDPNCGALARAALDLAEAGGALLHVARLREVVSLAS